MVDLIALFISRSLCKWFGPSGSPTRNPVNFGRWFRCSVWSSAFVCSPASSHRPQTSSQVNWWLFSKLPINVNVSIYGCLSVLYVIDWRIVQAVAQLWPNPSWDELQYLCDPLWKKGLGWWMNGCQATTCGSWALWNFQKNVSSGCQ